MYDFLNPLKINYVKNKDDYESLIGKTKKDALLYVPSNFVARSTVDGPLNQFLNQQVVIDLLPILFKVIKKNKFSKKYFVIECEIISGENVNKLQTLDVIFFNGNEFSLRNTFEIEKKITISGKLLYSKNGQRFYIAHPNRIYKNNYISGISEFEPVYPANALTNQNVIRKIIKDSVNSCEELKEWIPEKIIKKQKWLSWMESIKSIHNPKEIKDLTLKNPARQRLLFDELLARQVSLMINYPKIQEKSFKMLPSELLEKFINEIPFEFTNSQKIAIDEIKKDLEKETLMTRLLQGDVGSGKTIVAMIAAAQAIFSGYQVAFLAPTDILARQHFSSAQKMFKNFNVNVELYTGNQKGKIREEILKDLKHGKISLLVGTHALIQESVAFDKLGLVIIDEQQRFGVEQRIKMTERISSPELKPHILSLSATPIPRTLFMLNIGHMSISNLYEKPKNRQKIETRIMSFKKTNEIIDALNRVIERNEKVYWICPLVEESEKIDLTAATKRFNFLKNIFKENVAIVHGQQSKDEKEKNIKCFYEGVSKILVSTTVIETGVDVADASVMVIEHAERFGLSQLHQLRGRVGRSHIKSSCILLYDENISLIAKKRLLTIRNCDDGFKIAEMDLMLRGAGEFFGTKQSGSMKSRIFKSNFSSNDKFVEEELDIYSNILSLAIEASKEVINCKESCDILLSLHQNHVSFDVSKAV